MVLMIACCEHRITWIFQFSERGANDGLRLAQINISTFSRVAAFPATLRNLYMSLFMILSPDDGRAEHMFNIRSRADFVPAQRS